MTDDAELMRRYLDEGSEQAFGELVERYLDLVYSAAVRQVGLDAQLAQDVVQTVFTALARKARSLPTVVVLGGWLYRHTCFVARQTVRTECRRRVREQKAAEMNALNQDVEPAWEHLAPFLDEAMQRLRGRDRDAIVLRFFERKEMRGVGAALGTSEEAAKKRVARALEKLRILFKGRGLTLSSATLGSLLASHTVAAAPIGLAASLTSHALASAAAASSGLSAILATIVLTKIKFAAVCAVLIAGTATLSVFQYRANEKLRSQIEELREQDEEIRRLRVENKRLAAIRIDGEEMERLRIERVELLKLRGEIGVLRARERELAQFLPSPSQGGARNRAFVREIRGTAQYSGASTGWNDLRVGEAIPWSSTVKTGVGSQIDLFLGDNGPTLRLFEESAFSIEKLRIDRTGRDVVIETSLELKMGAIHGGVKPLADNSKYEVKTPSTVCSIRSGEFRISADGKHEIINGSALVIYKNARGAISTQTVNAGETFVPPVVATDPSLAPGTNGANSHAKPASR